jgi:hypothetical protein
MTNRWYLLLVVFAIGSGCDDHAQSSGEGPGTDNVTVDGDLLGVRVLGTGHLGTQSVRVEVTGEVEVVFFAGTYFDPKVGEGSYSRTGKAQRMMVANNLLLHGPGVFLIDANCMDAERHTPQENSEFYSLPLQPSTPVEICQRNCGDNQNCIWGCDGNPAWTEDDKPAWVDSVFQSGLEDQPYEPEFSDQPYEPEPNYEPYEPEPMDEPDEPDEPAPNGEVWIQLWIADDCNDNHPLRYRLFDLDSGETWPEQDVYESPGAGITTTSSFTCTYGNILCLGGETNGHQFGVGLDGLGDSSEYWCLSCGMTSLQGWNVGCQ